MNDSVNGVLSFFQNAPVQFDPTAIHAAKTQQEPGVAELKRAVVEEHLAEEERELVVVAVEAEGLFEMLHAPLGIESLIASALRS